MKEITVRLCAVALLIGLSSVVGHGKPVVFSVGADRIRDISVELARTKAHQVETALGVAPIPEPSTLILLGTGLAGFLGSRARRRSQK